VTAFEEIGFIDPAEAAWRLAVRPGLSFLDSASPSGGLGRYAILATDPFARFTVRDGCAFLDDMPLDDPPLRALERVLARHRAPRLHPDLPFTGGVIGRIDYDFGRRLDRVGLPPAAEPAGVELDLGFYDTVLVLDLAERRGFLCAGPQSGSDPGLRLARLRDLLSRPASPPAALPPVTDWAHDRDGPAYGDAVARVQDHIRAGDIYQANLSLRLTARLPEDYDPLAFYMALRRANPAPFAAYLAGPDGAVACSSPERFLRITGEFIEARPIKGTARRLADPAADGAARAALLASEKDRAENVMIVDLLRNDLSRLCRPGSVEVPVLCGLETYEGLHHLTSVVTGRLEPGIGPTAAIAACFPCGSITGAPKLAAMEIIAGLEQAPRGAAYGAIGWIGFDGDMDLNVAIRTVTLSPGRAEFRAGGGVTLASDPAGEHAEALLKAERILAAFAGAVPCS